MRSYERAWRTCWSVVAAVGCALAVLQSSAVAVLVMLGLLLLLCDLGRHLLPDLPRRWSSQTVALGVLATYSFCGVSPSLGVFVVLTAGLSSPAVIGAALRSARRSAGAPPSGRAPGTTPAEPPPEVDEPGYLTLPEAMGPLQGLDDLQLCRLWRDSFWTLREPASPATALCLVALREACLDELERRDAAALHAWLDHGARASGGPEKYLAHGPPARPGGDVPPRQSG